MPGRDVPLLKIPYANTANGDQRGWVFDIPLGSIPAQDVQQGMFVLTSSHGDLLAETDFLVASDQSNIYGEQRTKRITIR